MCVGAIITWIEKSFSVGDYGGLARMSGVKG